MGQSAPLSPAARSRWPVVTEPGIVCFAVLVLRALADVADRSRWCEADLAVALREAALPTEPIRIHAVLILLQEQGCVTNPVPLADGGLLLTVTGRALQLPAQAIPWRSSNDRGAPDPETVSVPAR